MKKRMTALIFVENPIGFSNSLECLTYLERLEASDFVLFFSGKLDNLLKYRQVKKVSFILQIKYTYWHVKIRDIKIFGKSLFPQLRECFDTFNKSIMRMMLRRIDRKYQFDIVIGDPWSLFVVPDDVFSSAERWVVQTGSAAGQRFQDYEQRGFMVFACGNHTAWGVGQSCFVENRQLFKKKRIREKKKYNKAIFISANQSDSLTNSSWYLDCMRYAGEVFDGEIMYFPRGTEDISSLTAFAEKFGFTILRPTLCLEDFLAFEAEYIPSVIFHVGSTAGFFLGERDFKEIWRNTILLPDVCHNDFSERWRASVLRNLDVMSASELSFEVFTVPCKAGLRFASSQVDRCP